MGKNTKVYIVHKIIYFKEHSWSAEVRIGVTLKKVLKDEGQYKEKGTRTQLYSGHRENYKYFKVEKRRALEGLNLTYAEFSISIKLHQSVASELMCIIETQDFVHKWKLNDFGLRYNERFIYSEFDENTTFPKEESKRLIFEMPPKPLGLHTPRVLSVSSFNWAADKINAKAHVYIDLMNDLPRKFTDLYNQLTHNAIQTSLKPLYGGWTEWTQVAKLVPANVKDTGGYNAWNEHKFYLPLYKPSEVQLQVRAVNKIGESDPSKVVRIKPAPAPFRLKVVRIIVSKGYPYKRDISLEWVNVEETLYDGIYEIQVYKNMFYRRQKNNYRPNLYGAWIWLSPKHVQVNMASNRGNMINSHTFTYVQNVECHFKTRGISVFGQTDRSNIVSLVKPKPPIKLTLLEISLTYGDPTKRNIKFKWDNPMNIWPNYVFKNHIDRRDFYPDGGSTWYHIPKSPFDVDVTVTNLTKTKILTHMSTFPAQFRVKAENYVGISSASNIVTIDNPLTPTNLSVEWIGFAETDTDQHQARDDQHQARDDQHQARDDQHQARDDQHQARDVLFKFRNHNLNKINKMYEVMFQYRFAKDETLEVWDPWRDSPHINMVDSGNLYISFVKYKDFRTEHKYPAVQFKMKIFGYIGESGFSNIVTIERPPPIDYCRIYQIYLHTVAKEGDMPTRDFEFLIANEVYPTLNRVIKVAFQYRISLDVDGNRGPWATTVPSDVDAEKWIPKETSFRDFYRWIPVDKDVFMTRAKARVKFGSYNYRYVQFRVLAIGFFGTSDPNTTVTIVVPSSPRELNVIYYGAEIQCYYTCKLELDWNISDDSGTFEIISYLIQHKKRSWANTVANWKKLLEVPDDVRSRIRRQHITFDNNYEYRVVARSIFGNSVPSNVVWSKLFVSNRLYVSYYIHPKDNKTVIFYLEWDKFIDKKISHYIVQSNLFFEHDRSVMKTEAIVDWRVFNATFNKSIDFLEYHDIYGISKKMFLPEFRVVTKYVNESFFGPTSCTNFIHFTKEQYLEKGLALKGDMLSVIDIGKPFPKARFPP